MEEPAVQTQIEQAVDDGLQADAERRSESGSEARADADNAYSDCPRELRWRWRQISFRSLLKRRVGGRPCRAAPRSLAT